MRDLPCVVLPFPGRAEADRAQWLVLDQPAKILAAHDLRDIQPLLRETDDLVKQGSVAAGFITYESAPAFDSAQPVRESDNSIPLAWMMICPPQSFRPQNFPPHGECVVGQIAPAISKAQHASAVMNVKGRIADGDAYQVNHTHPLRARFAGDPLSLFGHFVRCQFSPWMFFAETKQWAACSASPECFFIRNGGEIESRPMKGTRPPEAADELADSEKDRAENLMIVDMLRNDLARIPGAHSVRAGPLLQVETHPTVAQMTSAVRCRIPEGAGLSQIFAAMFPPASVTGAPKIAAMRAIRQLEKFPRGPYCGACGFAFENRARFSVAIRTAVVCKQSGDMTYGVGGGIVADSDPDEEWRETEVKALLFSKIPAPLLIETMRARDGRVALLPRHMARIAGSAERLGFRHDAKALRAAVEDAAEGAADAKLRLTLRADGRFDITSSPPPPAGVARLGVSDVRVFSGDALLRWKTNRRAVYEAALARAKARGWDDAILQNERGELTETCAANLALRRDGALLTPSLECGLLPGVLRAEMLARGTLREAKLFAEDLAKADEIFRLNALRGMEPVKLAD